jgi:hypothetical protein
MASPPDAAELATAVLASRKSGPAIRGRLMKRSLLRKAVKTAAPAPPAPTAFAPLVSVSSVQVPAPLELLPAGMSSLQQAAASVAPGCSLLQPRREGGISPAGMLPPSPAAPSGELPASGTPEAMATAIPPLKPAAVLAAAALAHRRSDPAMGGQKRQARRFRKPGMVYPAASRPPVDLKRDNAVVVEGLGSLSLQPAASDGHLSEVPIPASAMLPTSSQLWVASLSSDEDDEDDEVLLRRRLWPPWLRFLSRCTTPLMFAMMRRRHQSLAAASLLIMLLQETRKAGCRWVTAAAPVVCQLL